MNVVLLENNSLTTEGKALVAYLTETINEALEDKTAYRLNHLSGDVKDYFVKVMTGMNALYTPEKWIEQYPSVADAAYRNYCVVKGIAEERQAVSEQSKLVTELTAFKEAMQDEITALKAELAILKTGNQADAKTDTPDTKE
jgi:hypothetical protein